MLKKSYRYNRENRIKATCSICGKPIFNRMHLRIDQSNGYRAPKIDRYAHKACSKKTEGSWIPVW